MSAVWCWAGSVQLRTRWAEVGLLTDSIWWILILLINMNIIFIQHWSDCVSNWTLSANIPGWGVSLTHTIMYACASANLLQIWAGHWETGSYLPLCDDRIFNVLRDTLSFSLVVMSCRCFSTQMMILFIQFTKVRAAATIYWHISQPDVNPLSQYECFSPWKDCSAHMWIRSVNIESEQLQTKTNISISLLKHTVTVGECLTS